jgi:hypothetical protein
MNQLLDRMPYTLGNVESVRAERSLHGHRELGQSNCSLKFALGVETVDVASIIKLPILNQSACAKKLARGVEAIQYHLPGPRPGALLSFPSGPLG